MSNKIKEENLKILKENIKGFIKDNAEVNYNFNKDVNDALKRYGNQQIPNITTKYATKMAEALCDMIIDSNLSMVDKEFMLTSINYFINDAAIAEHHRSLDFEDRLLEIDLAVRITKTYETIKSKYKK